MPEPIIPEPAPETPKPAEGATPTPPATPAPAPAPAAVEPKPGEGGKPAEEPAGAKPAEKVVPKEYTLKLPDGSLLDKGTLEAKSKDAKARGLTNEEAQAEVDRENATLASYVDKAKAEWKTKVEVEWINELKNDKQLGGEALQGNIEMARRVIDKFGPELKKELDAEGYGNHPGLVRFMVKIGKAMANDTFINPPAAPAKDQRTMAERLYAEPKKG